jgi:acyl carrier protein/NAD(P)-dependent dehydrogenase (short-subunit alcohol dehydrogenase family)
MLELSMDMEADLGIDSIKRVEILGAVQEKFPDLPPVSAEELIELRTLQQIISKFKNNETEAKSAYATDSSLDMEKKEVAPQTVKTFPVIIKPLPRPDFVDFQYPQGSIALITDDSTKRSSLLAIALQKKGVKVGMVHFGKNEMPDSGESSDGICHFNLDTFDEKTVKALMEKILAENKKIVAFIHMNPSSSASKEKLLDVSGINLEILKAVFLMARDLKIPLTEAAANTRSAFMTVTQMDGQFGLNGYSTNDPLPGGFAGLTKSLRKEWGDVFCRVIDIHPSIAPQTVIEKILDELHDADLQLTEVGYTPQGRFTIALKEEE